MNQQPDPKAPEPQESQPRRPSKCAAFLLKSWTPTFTWNSTVLLYFISGLLAIIYGLFISHTNAQIIEFKQQYDCALNSACSVTLTLTETMTQPVFLYYGIDNFYQNHRLYIASQSASQLAGTDISLSDAKTSCTSAVTNQDLGVTVSWNGVTLDPTAAASPCGLVAKSYFTDTFELFRDSDVIPLNENGISWPANNVGVKFKQTPDSANTQWINPENEHFIVWMRSATFPNFKKLWARIDQDLPPGNYQIDIANKYDVSDFNGKKYVYLSTTSVFGGKNDFLVYVYFGIGVVFLLISVFFAGKSKNG